MDCLPYYHPTGGIRLFNPEAAGSKTAFIPKPSRYSSPSLVRVSDWTLSIVYRSYPFHFILLTPNVDSILFFWRCLFVLIIITSLLFFYGGVKRLIILLYTMLPCGVDMYSM